MRVVLWWIGKALLIAGRWSYGTGYRGQRDYYATGDMASSVGGCEALLIARGWTQKNYSCGGYVTSSVGGCC